MATQGFALFETAIGPCGIAWGARGIIGTQLPEGDDLGTRARVRRSFPEAREAVPPPVIEQAVESIRALLRGEAVDLGDIVLDMEQVPELDRLVYQAARLVPRGETVTYGEIARRLGQPGAARAIGQALGRNPFPIVVPCHRILAKGGRLGGFSATGGVTTKRRLLEIEGAAACRQVSLFPAAGKR